MLHYFQQGQKMFKAAIFRHYVNRYYGKHGTWSPNGITNGCIKDAKLLERFVLGKIKWPMIKATYSLRHPWKRHPVGDVLLEVPTVKYADGEDEKDFFVAASRLLLLPEFPTLFNTPDAPDIWFLLPAGN